jgi:penicillin-binding protein 1A
VLFPGVPEANGYNLDRLMNNDPGDPNGVVSIVEATALSINCAFLRLAHEVTLSKVVNLARSMGLTDATLNPMNPSLVIGSEAVKPLEMAAAYATVADGGIYHSPRFVNRVVDRTGTVIYNGEGPGRRVFSAQVAAEALVALRAVVQYGTGTAAALSNADVAGKTGTTENSVDAWFNGITPTMASSVWLGDPRGEVPMYVNGAEVFGADYPTQIWHDVMQYALAHTPYIAFPTPDSYDLPPVKYIYSASLEQDDLLSHDGVGATTCVWDGEVVPCATTTTSTTAPPGPRRAPTQAGGIAPVSPSPTSPVHTPAATPVVTRP